MEQLYTEEARDRHIRALMSAVSVRTTRKVEVTEELLWALVWAQARHTAALLVNPYNRMGDDWGDDTAAALDTMTTLFNFVWDQADTESCETWLNTPYNEENPEVQLAHGRVMSLGNQGCDGVCPELYQLNCPALPKEG